MSKPIEDVIGGMISHPGVMVQDVIDALEDAGYVIVKKASKPKTIELASDSASADTVYRVQKVTDSPDYTPGQFIAKDVMRALCDDPRWKVTVKEFK